MKFHVRTFLRYQLIFWLCAVFFFSCARAGFQPTGGDAIDTPGGDNDTPGGDNDTPGGDNDTPGGDNDTPGGDMDTPSGDNDTVTCPDDMNCFGFDCGPDPICNESCGTCNNPPAIYCDDDDTLLTYASTGSCESGKCSYEGSSLFCEHGCITAAKVCRVCDDKCSPVNTKDCTSGQIRTCEADIHGCLDWSEYTPCDGGSCEDSTSCILPTIISVSPNMDAAGIAINAQVIINFSVPMDTTATESAITFTPDVSGISYSWSDGDKTSTIDHSSDFAVTEYTVTIETVASGKNDNNLAAPYQFSFATNPLNLTVDCSAADMVGKNGSIEVDGSNVYMSYYDSTNDTLKFAKSTDGGAIWPSEDIKTIASVNLVLSSMYSSIAVDGNNIYIGYSDFNDGYLKFAKSTDGGSTWPVGNIRTVDSGCSGRFASMEVNGTYIYLSYQNYTSSDLKFAKSIDGGANWLPSPAIDPIVDATNTVGAYTSIAADGNNVYISYYEGTAFNEALKFAKSINGGINWSTVITVDGGGSYRVGETSSIAVKGSNVYISYYNFENKSLRFARSIDGGANWPIITDVDDPAINIVGLYTSIAVDDSNVYISYWDSTDGDLKFAKSTDDGVTWPAGNIKIVDSTDNVGMYTSIAVDGTFVYIGYYDSTNTNPKFAKSTDGGATW